MAGFKSNFSKRVLTFVNVPSMCESFTDSSARPAITCIHMHKM